MHTETYTFRYYYQQYLFLFTMVPRNSRFTRHTLVAFGRYEYARSNQNKSLFFLEGCNKTEHVGLSRSLRVHVLEPRRKASFKTSFNVAARPPSPSSPRAPRPSSRHACHHRHPRHPSAEKRNKTKTRSTGQDRMGVGTQTRARAIYRGIDFGPKPFAVLGRATTA